MYNPKKLVLLFLLICLVFNITFSFSVIACKDIVAVGDSTDGDYNLLLKVRDPSREGLQVLCIVPYGYNYDYHDPWTGKSISYTTYHKYIGVATKDDVIPNIVKAGMSLSDAGLAFGDADTNSFWNNPTRNAWDDFDWIRYACEKADNEDEAVSFLTEDLVDEMHASGVSENLFVVGPKKGYVVEADAFHYDIKEINDGVIVMSNYPKELWETQYLQKLPIARSFDIVVEKEVRNKGVVRLGSIYGVKIVEIGEDFISVKPVSLIHATLTRNLGVITKIQLGERKTVGEFSVELLEINNNKAKISARYVYNAWEEKMLEYIQPKYGSITVKDMMNWSRLNIEDLDGLRPICEEQFEYEAVAVYKIPERNYETLSIGWFAPNHASSSVYVPFHICNTDIYDPYENGDAAQLCLDLYKKYDTNSLANNFRKIEEVFINEINEIEAKSEELIREEKDISNFLTTIDKSMQKQAYLTEQLWMEASNKADIIDIISDIWNSDYLSSLNGMKEAVIKLEEIQVANSFSDKIMDIAIDIAKSRIDAAKTIDKDVDNAEISFNEGKEFFNKGDYNQGFNHIINAYSEADGIIKESEIEYSSSARKKETDEFNLLFLLIAIILIILLIILICNIIFK